jgi:hypothetical protein
MVTSLLRVLGVLAGQHDPALRIEFGGEIGSGVPPDVELGRLEVA